MHPNPEQDASGTAKTEAGKTVRFDHELLKNRYRMEKELGRGGFATTFLASDTQLDSRPVVIKVLLEYHAEDPWVLKKFRQEMQALARLDHPGIVGALDFGELPDGNPFLVMQFVKGQTLRAAMTAKGMDFQRAANIVRQLGQALSAAHDSGICHRDVKPENIMLQNLGEGEEQAKLIDFGIASIRDARRSTSESTKIAGSLDYMALEQFEGKSSPASDVYALGAIAYEMLTGRHPYFAETTAELLRIRSEGVRIKPRDLRPRLTEAAQDCILKALSNKPEDRFARARDFGESLARALGSDTAVSFPPTIQTGTTQTTSSVESQVGTTKRPLDIASQTVEAKRQSEHAEPSPLGKKVQLRGVVLAVLGFVIVVGGLIGYRTLTSNSTATIPQPNPQIQQEKQVPPKPEPAQVTSTTVDKPTPVQRGSEVEKTATKITSAPAGKLPAQRRALTADEYGGPLRGELRWSGNLASQERLTIQAGHVLLGSLNDDLPLVPITIEVVPSGIDIVEAPSAQNNWDRLVLRNASKNEINSITVRWKIAR